MRQPARRLRVGGRERAFVGTGRASFRTDTAAQEEALVCEIAARVLAAIDPR